MATPNSNQETPVNVALLKQLSETPGVAGREEQVRALVIEQLKPLVDEVTVDALGNVIALKKGSSNRRVMLAAHMDEIGFIVRYVEKDGWLRVQPLGGFDPRVLVAQRVLVHTRQAGVLRGVFMPQTKPIHLLDGKPEAAKLEELYIDLGLPGDMVCEQVRIGDFVTMDRTLEQLGNRVTAKAMDDRAGVFTMIEAMRKLGEHKVNVLAVATVQEEVGLRGATTSTFSVEPDVAIALDVTLALDTPGTPEADAVTRLGDGAAIKVFDSSAISNYKFVQHMLDVAERHNIPHQMEVLARGGTDAGAMQRGRGGAAAMTISVPTRYVHTVNEMVDLGDLDAASTLLARYLEVAHTGDYSL
ncbi:MAG TPA: M42 family metallopeptidase [Ktedonobacterales bacterium]|nr:M42 family metallopeptidase [Ktedonobacterales bacterium]